MKIQSSQAVLTKMITGIQGFDEISDGGLPRGRTTLVMGGPGSGKTVFALQSLVNGAHTTKEGGIFVAFEESTRQIIANAATFGWDLPALQKKKLFFCSFRVTWITGDANAASRHQQRECCPKANQEVGDKEWKQVAMRCSCMLEA